MEEVNQSAEMGSCKYIPVVTLTHMYINCSLYGADGLTSDKGYHSLSYSDMHIML